MTSTAFTWMQDGLWEMVLPVAVALGVALALLLARRFLLRWLEGLSGRTNTEWPELVAGSLRMPTLLWCVALALAAGLEAAPIPRRLATWGSSLAAVLIILSITIVAANAGTRYLHRLAERQRIDIALTGLGTALLKIVVFIIGGLVVLSTLGIAITPLVAALGVGGIAVALALQDILSNLFGGVFVLAERRLRVGDNLKLESGQEGIVMDIGWRTTRLQMPPNQTVIVPNSKLTQGILTLREPEGAHEPAGVGARGGSQRRPGSGQWGC